MPRQRCNVAVDNHTFVNALPWMYRTGAPWRELPECHGKWVTVCQRFNRRSRNGATGRLFAALQEKRINGAESRILRHQAFKNFLESLFFMPILADFQRKSAFFSHSTISVLPRNAAPKSVN